MLRILARVVLGLLPIVHGLPYWQITTTWGAKEVAV
jgi:hypothetical protein